MWRGWELIQAQQVEHMCLDVCMLMQPDIVHIYIYKYILIFKLQTRNKYIYIYINMYMVHWAGIAPLIGATMKMDGCCNTAAIVLLI